MCVCVRFGGGLVHYTRFPPSVGCELRKTALLANEFNENYRFDVHLSLSLFTYTYIYICAFLTMLRSDPATLSGSGPFSFCAGVLRHQSHPNSLLLSEHVQTSQPPLHCCLFFLLSTLPVLLIHALFFPLSLSLSPSLVKYRTDTAQFTNS